MICEICNNGINFSKLCKHLNYTHKISTKEYYDNYIKKSEEGYCLFCKKEVPFRSLEKGYRKYCSSKCAANDPVKQNKTKKTNIEKYGCEHHNQSKEVQENRKITCIKRYGVDHPLKNKEVQTKIINTNMKKYGVNRASKTDAVKQKIQDTNMKKYSVKFVSKVPEFKKKIKSTNMKKYGVENVYQCKEIQDKIRKTMIDRYGVFFYSKTKEYKDKTKNTNLKRYGVEFVLQNSELLKKAKETNLKRYGFEYPLYNLDIKNKANQTNLKKYGTIYPSQNMDIKKRIRNTNLKKYGVEIATKCKEIKEKIYKSIYKKYGFKYLGQSPEIKEKIKFVLLERYGVDNYSKSEERVRKRKYKFYENLLNSNRLRDKCIPNFNKEEYNITKDVYSWICKKCNNEFEDHLNNGRIPRCPVCYPILTGFSKMEKEVVEFINSNNLEIIENYKKIIFPYELDIFVPSKNIAIEFNGLYWHSELSGNKNKYYHLNKTKLCEEKGIKLLHIFEDEWLNKGDVVKSILLNKLGLIKDKIYARNTLIKEIKDIKQIMNFLENNHIQGYVSSSLNIGLFYNDELVSLLTLGKPRYNKKYEWEILRFCSKININVLGGFGKLFNYFIKKYNPKNVLTYSDLRYGTGEIYLKNKFNILSNSLPNYYYIDSKYDSRIVRIQFQKHKLKDKLEIFDSNLTEWQNMQLNGYDRIWDCGNSVFEWINN